MLGLNFLVDNQVDQAIDELTQATSTDTDALEIQMILGNLYRAEGTGRPRHQRAPGAPAAARPDDARARLRAALPGARLPARRLRRPRARGVSGGRAARPAQPLRARQPAEAVRGPAPVGRGAARARADRRRSTPAPRPEDQQILGFLRNEIGSAQARAGDVGGRGRRRSSDAIDIDARHRARVSESRRRPRAAGQPGRRPSRRGRRSSQAVPDRAYLAFERLERAYRDARRAAAVRRALSSG